jgi:hypothetical protein
MKFDIQGIEGVTNEIKSLSDDKLKRREILKVLRRQVKPILEALKQNTPIAQNDITVRGTTYSPGNLKKAMAIKTSPSKKYPNVLIGPRYGRGGKKYDGFYAWWIEYAKGTHESNPTGGKNFIQKTLLQKGDSVTKVASEQLKKYIDKKAKTLNL